MADRKKANNRETAAELRNLTVQELTEKLSEQRTELLHARFKVATAQLAQVSELKAMRKQVARISTILKEKAREDIHAGS
ncbi:MAG TPA: 50S ribosomal protein L29 [Candidatus Desulfovibrio intestinipullorum]|uniref:Large ribosomal subunit protein uL29 n=1 Tax=Candidatus Desulfovibrio intestinipullorum TaxID=2838536 RepID=A0A9D1PXF6_9BACT|nr:50S ribosomal protein L29 [Candidatus Desulfovibrio intestinipullorum]